MSKIPFTVSARTARLIGRENVANAEGAIIELIKNCYDADSKNTILYIDRENHQIIIFDTGEGMDDGIISEQWMTIGTDDKLNNAITRSGRIKSGAKGIGRFALDRLGSKCKMITFPQKSEIGYQWNVDWGQFELKGGDGRNVKINEVFADLTSIENSKYYTEVLKNIQSKSFLDIFLSIHKKSRVINGTILIITDTRDNWTDNNIEKVYNTLELLNPPEGEKRMNIWLIDPQQPHKFGLVDNDSFEDYDYKLTATYNKNKDLEVLIDIHRNEFDYNLIPKELFDYEEMKQFPFDEKTFEKENFQIKRNFSQLMKGFTDNKDIAKNIGSFEFVFYFLKNQYTKEDREKFYYKEFLGSRSKWLEKFGGIKLYRDEFRIRPYGEINTQAYDWLMLGERYGQNPAAFSRKGSRVRPNQVAGVVKFSRIGNPFLEDKSNREGIQDSETFDLFKNLLLNIIKVQEDDRSTIGFNLDRLKSDLDEDEKNLIESENLAKSSDDENESQKETQEKNKKLKKGVLTRDKKLQEKEDELATSRAMASAGIMISSFSHEFHGLKNNLISRISLLNRKIKKVVDESAFESPDGIKLINEIEKLNQQDQKIRQWIEFAIGLTKKDRRKNKKINLINYFQSFKQTWDNNLFKERNISFNFKFDEEESESLNTKISELDLDTIFDNLITNSVEAFTRNGGFVGARNIDIQILSEGKDVHLVYTDSGPGITNAYTKINDILKPFETSKTDDLGNQIGTGLGMWLVKSATDSNKGKLLLSRPKNGFKIEFWFKKIQ
ncbi:sensor histidine kinase [Chryseobacterium sp. Hurlbut01]|uniref:sensor histidine kinase n=1 Tax=Chryseobacterium sp. Hurlbut01 TaxID=1681828 RepID=UPI00067ACFEB|nr:ATP-binding protein [Chryseobacterium sp. Hurlbut01]